MSIMERELEILEPHDFETYLHSSPLWSYKDEQKGPTWRCSKSGLPLRLSGQANTFEWKKRALGSIAVDERRSTGEVLSDIQKIVIPTTALESSMKLNMLATNQEFIKRRYDKLARRLGSQELMLYSAFFLAYSLLC